MNAFSVLDRNAKFASSAPFMLVVSTLPYDRSTFRLMLSLTANVERCRADLAFHGRAEVRVLVDAAGHRRPTTVLNALRRLPNADGVNGMMPVPAALS